MSVLRIPVRATRTLIVPTLTVLIAVLVNKDSMETDYLVKVLHATMFLNSISLKLEISIPCDENSDYMFTLLRLFIMPDFDECSLEPSPCDENADCTNTDGSYSCTCKQGFTGNGSICEGVRT